MEAKGACIQCGHSSATVLRTSPHSDRTCARRGQCRNMWAFVWTEPHSGHSEDISGSQECFASSRRERTRDVSCENQLVLRRELLQHASRLKSVDFRGPLKAISMGQVRRNRPRISFLWQAVTSTHVLSRPLIIPTTFMLSPTRSRVSRKAVAVPWQARGQ